MASFHHASRFPGPMFSQNIPTSNPPVNPGGDRCPRPQFQRPPNVAYRPFQPPERFMQGYQPRPQFPNLPEAVDAGGFRNRPPPPNQIFPMSSAPPSNQVFHMNAPPPPRPPNQVFRMNTPPPPHPPPPNQVFHMTTPPPPPPNQAFHMNTPPPPRPPRPNQMFRMNSPPPNPSFGMSSQPPPIPNQEFRMNVTSSAPRLQFRGPFDSPPRHWKHMPSFRGPKSPHHQNRPRPPQLPHQSRDFPLQTNKRKKQKTREFRKLKDNTEKPFSCDTCDRAFAAENELKDHLSQHIKCNHENCIFEAHPKIVALHKKMQHDTGYADRISKLRDDAEIKKWREERKRRFPTAENIKRRQAEQAEKEARGEVLETKEFGKFQRRKENGNVANNQGQRKRARYEKRNHDRRKNFKNHPCSQPFIIKVDSESDSDSDSHITLKKFTGLSSLTNSAAEKCNKNGDNKITSDTHAGTDAVIDEHQFSTSEKQNLPKSNSENNVDQHSMPCSDNNSANGKIEEILIGEKMKESESPEKPSISVGISELNPTTLKDFTKPADQSVCEIPGEEIVKPEAEMVVIEDSDDDEPIATRIAKSVEKPIVNYDKFKNCKKSVSPVEKASDISAVESAKNSNSNKQLKQQQKKFNGFSEKQDPECLPRKSTLLEKLLADDIRHERNVVLQCIRHIVNNNFFGIGAKKS